MTAEAKIALRLQDTVSEKPSAAIDNLDRAERLGLLKSANEWMTLRKLGKAEKQGKSE